jgi:hypothetical protein
MHGRNDRGSGRHVRIEDRSQVQGTREARHYRDWKSPSDAALLTSRGQRILQLRMK